MGKRKDKFWQQGKPDELPDQNWEALCDGCGRCCMIKFEDEDTGEILYTDVACRLFDEASCRCTDYAQRTQQIPGCLNIRDFDDAQYTWLPETCAYRLLHEGKPLFDWHPLISGSADSVFQAGISVQGKSVPEHSVSETEMANHIIAPEEASACPCGSDLLFGSCCGPIIGGEQAKSAEALMRSRYSAYVLGHWDYLWKSWHPDTRPGSVSPTNTQWLGLSIIESTACTVEFIAGFKEGAKIMALHEISHFKQVDGQWRYVDGSCDIKQAGRNAPCPCGSGRKTKRCCGSS